MILASASPRRKELLEKFGYEFTVKVSEVDESKITETDPVKLVKILAEMKANAIENSGEDIIISADTVVSLDNKIFGKPTDEKHAFDMLKELSGKTHQVHTGVCIKSADNSVVFAVKTDVVFYNLSEDEINDYVKTGEPLDKAGAYGIQGLAGAFVKEIHGDYFNVVGLPIPRLIQELKWI